MIRKRKVLISDTVKGKIAELKLYLTEEYKFSFEAAMFRTKRMEEFIETLANPADYSLCRFLRWRKFGYRCAVFEKTWIFAYEIFDDGVIVRDMAHVSMLKE